MKWPLVRQDKTFIPLPHRHWVIEQYKTTEELLSFYVYWMNFLCFRVECCCSTVLICPALIGFTRSLWTCPQSHIRVCVSLCLSITCASPQRALLLPKPCTPCAFFSIFWILALAHFEFVLLNCEFTFRSKHIQMPPASGICICFLKSPLRARALWHWAWHQN